MVFCIAEICRRIAKDTLRQSSFELYSLLEALCIIIRYESIRDWRYKCRWTSHKMEGISNPRDMDEGDITNTDAPSILPLYSVTRNVQKLPSFEFNALAGHYVEVCFESTQSSYTQQQEARCSFRTYLFSSLPLCKTTKRTGTTQSRAIWTRTKKSYRTNAHIPFFAYYLSSTSVSFKQKLFQPTRCPLYAVWLMSPNGSPFLQTQVTRHATPKIA